MMATCGVHELASSARAGLQVETFASTREFMKRPPPDGPACLVLDVRLVGENGLLVQQALQAATHRPLIIFLTGYGTVPRCVQAMKGGAIDFLQKPVDENVLEAAIATARAQDARTRDRQRHRAELHQRFATLTPREREVMGLAVAGLLNKEIAYALGTTEKTIKHHRRKIKQKMQVTSVVDLVRMAALLEMGAPQPAERLHLSS
jgi:RNA polymerase sigma factor (sigma-70 family)